MATENETIISDLTAATSIDDSDYLVIEDAVNTKKVTAGKLSEYIKGDGYIRVGQKAGTTAGSYSTIEGKDNTATGESSHAEGASNVASALSSHAEGQGTIASGIHSHAEGTNTVSNGQSSHSEGENTVALNMAAHAEGYAVDLFDVNTDTIPYVSTDNWPNYDFTNKHWVVADGEGAHIEGYSQNRYHIAIGRGAHTEGVDNVARGRGAHAEGGYTYASGEAAHAEGYASYATSFCAHTEGNLCVATNSYAHAEGHGTTASGSGSHAEGGGGNIASGERSHVEGSQSKATGSYSHAEGLACESSGEGSHAEGGWSDAYGTYSHAANNSTKANFSQTTVGINNLPKGTTDSYTSNSGYFIVGCGGEYSATGVNCFRATESNTYGKTYSTSGADYAEMFEWKDGNKLNDDRAGKFVTLDGNKIVLATSSDDYILGVVSGNPSVCGDVYDDQWQGMLTTDIFGRPIYEKQVIDERKDEEGNVIVKAHTNDVLKIDPSYDPSKPYIPRSDRPEWSPVGLLGKLVCIDDGTAEVNSYVKVNDDSIATASSERTKYRVMERLDKNHIRIMIL